MRSTCIEHPKDEALIVVRKWHLEATGGHKAAAALLSFFEYWHNHKLEQRKKAKAANDVAERHQEERSQDEGLIQHNTEQELMDGVLIAGRGAIAEGIRILEDRLGFVKTMPNPNPRYRFDKTRHFLFLAGAVNEWLKGYKRGYNDQPESRDPSAENGRRSPENGSRSPDSGRTSPETTSETTPEKDPPTDGAREDEPESGKGEEAVEAFWGELIRARAVRGTALNDQRPVSRRFERDLGREAGEELSAGRDPATVGRAVRRMGLRWDAYPMDLAQAVGDVLDGKPWTVEGKRERERAHHKRSPPRPDPGANTEEAAARRREGRPARAGPSPPEKISPEELDRLLAKENR